MTVRPHFGAEAAEKFLERISCPTDIKDKCELLREIQVNHLTHVPFENLDIANGLPVTLDLDSLYNKIVSNYRGGICYEVNTLLGVLLADLGYEVHYLAATVPHCGDEYDHILLKVIADDKTFIVDVGMGDGGFLYPLELKTDVMQEDPRNSYYIVKNTEYYHVHCKREGEPDQQLYFFRDRDRITDDYASRMRYFTTDPTSPFANGPLCFMETLTGRMTVVENKLIITDGKERKETDVSSPEEFDSILRNLFGVKI